MSTDTLDLRTIVVDDHGGRVWWWEVYIPDVNRRHGRAILAEGCSRWRWMARIAARQARRRIRREATR